MNSIERVDSPLKRPPLSSVPGRLKDVQSIDELSDVYNHFLLYYGRDIPKMQNAAKANKKKLKKIKEVSEEDGRPRTGAAWKLSAQC